VLKELLNPNPANFNIMVSKLSDILVKSLDEPLGYAINWGRVFSLWPVHLETSCCSVEFGAASSPRYDVERFGILEAFGSLRQCDLIVVQGTVTRKMAPRLRMVYDQMPEPKYVIAMGACAITGGLFSTLTMFCLDAMELFLLMYMYLDVLQDPKLLFREPFYYKKKLKGQR
jgi:NADH-quinone oxidoreductase subunit B